MSKFASMIVAATLFASVATAAPVQDAKPPTDAAPAKVRGQAETRQKPAAKTKQVDTKKVDAKQAERKQGEAKETAERRARTEGESAGTPAARRADEAKPAAGEAHRKGAGKALNREEMTKKLALEERKHRERLAKIARLRALAEEKKQTERVAALDDLLAKENARYARWIEEGRQVLGNDEFKRIDGKLQKGRRHTGKTGPDGKAPIRTESAGKPEKRDRAEKGGN